MLKCNLRIVLRYLFYDLSPKSGRIQYVRLVNACHLLAALHGNVKGLDGNSADLVLVVGKSINCLGNTVLFDRFSFSEIKSACKLTHNDHVKTVSNNLVTKRAGCTELIV